MMALRGRFARAQSADPRDGAAGRRIPDLVHPVAGGCSSRWSRRASALRGIGDFKPGMIVQTATVVLNIVLAPVLMFGWGTGHPLGVAGTAIASFVAVVVGVLGLIVYVVRKRGYLEFVRREWRAAARDVGTHAGDRSAGGRRVRADGRLHGRRSIRSRGGSARRRRRASASACA